MILTCIHVYIHIKMAVTLWTRNTSMHMNEIGYINLTTNIYYDGEIRVEKGKEKWVRIYSGCYLSLHSLRKRGKTSKSLKREYRDGQHA